MHCGRKTFTMVHTVSLLLLVVAAASAASELDNPIIICETYTEGVTDIGKSIELQPSPLPPGERTIIIPIPQIWSNGCLVSGTKVELCHARSESLQTNLDSVRLVVQRSPDSDQLNPLIIKITSYCSGINPGTNVLPKLDWE